MCNLSFQTKSQDAMRHAFDTMPEDDEALIDLTGHLPPMTGFFPDHAAPIIRHRASGGGQLTKARWGMPTPQVCLAGKRTDPGVTNIRNVAASHWRRGLAATTADALRLLRLLADGMAQIVAEGVRGDAA